MLKKVMFFLFFVCFTFQLHAEETFPETILSPTNRYTVLEKLGSGALGEVFSVEDSQGNRFALKALKTQDHGEGFFAVLADAKREYEIGQLLDHPNIIKSIEFFEDSTQSENHFAYLVLEYVEGLPLYRYTKGAFTEEQAYEVNLQFIEALRYGFSLDLLFLDLHGGNVMISDDFELMMIDLSSFFTFDELVQLKSYLYSGSKSESEPNTATSTQSEKTTRQTISNPRLQKLARELKQYLSANPRLNEQFKQRSLEARGDTQKIRQTILDIYFPYHFDRITNICVGVLSKTDLSKEEKIDHQTKIKRLAWSYLYDAEDGIHEPIETHLDRLKSIFK